MEQTGLNQEWSAVSRELLENSEDFQLWEKLIKTAEANSKRGINKTTPEEEVSVLRVSYQKLLDKYPLLVNYWIRYAEWEFKLGDTHRSEQVYTQSFRHLSYSIELWISYLNFRINTLNNNLSEILDLFEIARKSIGYHFHASDFYKLYLIFLQNYQDDTNNFKAKYYILLRIIIEVPLYNYEYFFKILFDEIASISTQNKDIIAYLVPQREISKKMFEPKTAATHLKKIFIDVYITTQFKVYELFTFEKKLTRSYFDFKYISQQQLETWSNYLEFLELKKYPQAYVEFVYERGVLVTALYPNLWIKYANYHISHGKYMRAIETLTRAYALNNNYKLLIKLVDINLFLKNVVKARDLVLAYIRYNSSIPIPIYEKLINIERLINFDEEYLENLFREIINESGNPWFFEHLLYYSISNECKQKLFVEFESEFIDSEIYKSAQGKLKNLKADKRESINAELQEVDVGKDKNDQGDETEPHNGKVDISISENTQIHTPIKSHNYKQQFDDELNSYL